MCKFLFVSQSGKRGYLNFSPLILNSHSPHRILCVCVCLFIEPRDLRYVTHSKLLQIATLW